MSAHAVVIGGGIGGLLAAHALAHRFERVTVVERDRYPAGSTGSAPAVRRGVPQSRCVHLVMAAGAAAFEQLVPGWRDEMGARGAGPFDASADALLWLSAGWLPRTASGITAYSCSRALLEAVLRRRLVELSGVQLREGLRVLGLLADPSRERVTGIHAIEGRGGGATTLRADLVVDASGAGSALPRFLDELRGSGASQVDKTIVKPGTQYVSRWFKLDPADAPDWRFLSIAPRTGAALRSAMMLRAENDRWGLVLLAPAGEPLPDRDAAFLDFVAGLGDGKLREALAGARPVSAIHRYGHTANRLTHYERLAGWPAGLVALGDGVCALDPYFGLGMTLAARGAVLLCNWLDRQSTDAAACCGFQQELAALNSEPWRLATGCTADGHRLGRDAHLRGLCEAAPASPDAAHALLATQHLLHPARPAAKGRAL
jgi:2-polyprenyl-6-methoxyphenol hydroxylase-like FAD-dependent oxidoreductase